MDAEPSLSQGQGSGHTRHTSTDNQGTVVDFHFGGEERLEGSRSGDSHSGQLLGLGCGCWMVMRVHP